MDRILVIIPTFNEVRNIATLLEEIMALDIGGLEVLVVDDNSPDGTADAVARLRESDARVHLMKRTDKQGLGTAYIDGFNYALEWGYGIIIEMDGDRSHDPKTLPELLEAITGADVVIASRYINGVNVLNWPLGRLLLSVYANQYTRIVTGMPLTDSTSGFKCFRRRVLESIPLDRVQSNGYSFQIEMNFKAWKRNFRIKEIPTVFTDRSQGRSKMTPQIKVEAFYMVIKLKLLSLLGLY